MNIKQQVCCWKLHYIVAFRWKWNEIKLWKNAASCIEWSFWHVKWLDTVCVCVQSVFTILSVSEWVCVYMWACYTEWCKMNNIHCLFVYKYFLQLFAHHVTNAQRSKHISTHSTSVLYNTCYTPVASSNTSGRRTSVNFAHQKNNALCKESKNKIAATKTRQINKQKMLFVFEEYTREESKQYKK